MALVDEIIFLLVVDELHRSLKRLFLPWCCFKAGKHIEQLGYAKEHWENEDVDVNKIVGFVYIFLGEVACLICK